MDPFLLFEKPRVSSRLHLRRHTGVTGGVMSCYQAAAKPLRHVGHRHLSIPLPLPSPCLRLSPVLPSTARPRQRRRLLRSPSGDVFWRHADAQTRSYQFYGGRIAILLSSRQCGGSGLSLGIRRKWLQEVLFDTLPAPLRRRVGEKWEVFSSDRESVWSLWSGVKYAPITCQVSELIRIF